MQHHKDCFGVAPKMATAYRGFFSAQKREADCGVAHQALINEDSHLRPCRIPMAAAIVDTCNHQLHTDFLSQNRSLDCISNELYSSDSRNGEFMAIPSRAGKAGTIVVSALRARTNFGKLLRRIDDERGSLVIEKRGIPRAVLLSIRDYVKLAAPEPEVLRVLGEESERNRTSA